MVIYGSVLGVAAGLNWIMARHAVRAELVHARHREATAAWGGREFVFIPAVFLLSIPVALASPLAAELMWVALALLRIAKGWTARQKRS